jgi:hypothetical protein
VLVVPIEEDRVQTGVEAALQVMDHRVTHHERLAGLDAQCGAGPEEDPRIRLALRELVGAEHRIDLAVEADQIELELLVGVLAVGQDCREQAGLPDPAQRRDGIGEAGPPGLVEIEVSTERFVGRLVGGEVEVRKELPHSSSSLLSEGELSQLVSPVVRGGDGRPARCELLVATDQAGCPAPLDAGSPGGGRLVHQGVVEVEDHGTQTGHAAMVPRRCASRGVSRAARRGR